MGYFRQRPQQARKVGATAALCGLMAAGALPGAFPPLANLSASPAYADSMPQDKTVNIDVVNADIRSVISVLQRQTGVNVVIQDGGRPFGTVSVTLSHATFQQALRMVALSANATVTKTDDGMYVIRAADPGTTVSAGAGDAITAASPVAPTDAQAAPDAAPAVQPDPPNMTWRTIVLQHAIPSDVLKIMHWDKDMVILDPYNGMDKNAMKNTPTMVTDSNPVLLGNAPSVPIGRGNNTTNDQANRSVDPSGQAQQFPGGYPGGGYPPGGGGYNPGGGYPGGGGYNPGFQRNRGGFGNNPFQQGANGQQPQANLPDGVKRIYALEGTNRLFVEATPDGFNNIRDIVKQLDIAPRQVQIKVEFVTASVNDVNAFGINFNLVPYPGVEISNDQGNSAQQVDPQTFVQVASGNIVAQMYASLTQGRGKVVQAPMITTTNNVPASIQVQTEIPYVTTTNVVGNGGNVVSNQQQSFIPINTGLQVSPRINSDDTITLNLQPQISDVAGAPSTQGGPPPTTTQSLQTLRTVRSGETMVLGGLVRKSDSTSQSRIPFLSDLPIIGNFFKNHIKQVNDSELLIFVTPTIIDDSNDSTSGSGGANITVAP